MRIGFVDYNLSNFHAGKFLSILRERHGEVAQLACAWGLQESESRNWCTENGISWGGTAKETARSVDAVMILSPDNAEFHLPLAKEIFPECRRVFIDKTFAPSLKEGKAIFDLAERHGTQVFSSSALRFAPKLTEYCQSELARQAVDLELKGPNNWDTYGIHVVEPIVAAFGPALRRVRAGGTAQLVRVDLQWKDGRTGHLTVNGHAPQPFEMIVTSPGKTTTLSLADTAFYDRLFDAIVSFFKGGAAPVAAEETLAALAILEAVRDSREQDGAWIEIS